MASKLLRGGAAGGGDIVITSAETSTTRTVSSANPTFADVTDLSVTFTAAANEYVEVQLNKGDITSQSGVGTTIALLQYVLDSDAGVLIVRENLSEIAGNDIRDALSASVFIGPLSAGSHTVKIQGAQVNGNFDVSTGTTLSVVQYGK